MSKPVVAIVGRSNVGKSTLFNRLVGQRKAIVEDTPGITRDRLYATASWRGRDFAVVDTGGMALPAGAPVKEQVRRQAERAVEEADVILFVVDAASGLLPDDRDVAEYLRASRRPLLVVANKVDHPKHTGAYEFYELGLGEIIPVSALHGLGTGDLLDQVVALLRRGSQMPPPLRGSRLRQSAAPTWGNLPSSTRSWAKSGSLSTRRPGRHAMPS